MVNSLLQKLVVVTIALLIGFVLCEFAVRVLGHTDVNGNFYFRNQLLKPYHLPRKTVEHEINRYLASDSSFMLYDSLLGWKPRPKSVSSDGYYRYNSRGLRAASTEDDIGTDGKVLHIAFFGDSFIHGSEVTYEQTMGYYLEQALKQAGFRVEVLNFGVPGYGVDQAFMRWQSEGRQYSPDIVILGFVPVDIKRNVNMVRALLSPDSGWPFLKPRFLLSENGSELINMPAPPPTEVLGILDNLNRWELRRYEYYYHPEDFEMRIWHHSKFFTVLVNYLQSDNVTWQEGQRDFYALDDEPAKLTIAIVDAFRADVIQHDGKFIVVHVLQRQGLSQLVKGKKLNYENILEEIERRNLIVMPDQYLLTEAKNGAIKELYQLLFEGKSNSGTGHF